MYKLTMTAAALALAGFASPALAGEQDFVLVNNTGYNVDQVYVSPTRVDVWQEDVLGDYMLMNGERATIRFNRAEDACLWDVKLIYEDGETVVWPSFNLCEISVISINYNDTTGDTVAEFE